jgi:hypothetical protein
MTACDVQITICSEYSFLCADVLSYMLSYTDASTAANAALVSKHWRFACTSNVVWTRHLDTLQTKFSERNYTPPAGQFQLKPGESAYNHYVLANQIYITKQKREKKRIGFHKRVESLTNTFMLIWVELLKLLLIHLILPLLVLVTAPVWIPLILIYFAFAFVSRIKRLCCG